MRMPFGKYRGFQVDDLPEDYLQWLIDNVDLREPLRSAVYETVGLEMSASLPAGNEIKQIYRRLARKWHPDHGGSTEAMQAINEFYIELTENT